jgi:hypothetical protein
VHVQLANKMGFTFSSYLLNVLLQLANKEWDSKQKQKQKKIV